MSHSKFHTGIENFLRFRFESFFWRWLLHW